MIGELAGRERSTRSLPLLLFLLLLRILTPTSVVSAGEAAGSGSCTQLEPEGQPGLAEAGSAAEPKAVEPPTGGGSATSAPPTASPNYLEWYGRSFRIDPHELAFTQRYYWERLSHPNSRDKAWGAGVLVGALSLWAQKNQLQSDSLHRGWPAEHDPILDKIQKLGGGGVVPAMALLFYLGGSATSNYRAKETGLMLVESLLFTDLLTATGRWVLAEDRPKYGGSLHPFRGYGGGVSGHSATAASISGVLSRMYLQVRPTDRQTTRIFKRIGRGLAYGLPVLVAYGRFNDQQHFAYNTVLGAGIGFWTSGVVADAHCAYLEGPASRWKPAALEPILSDRGAPGIGVRWAW